MKEQATGSIPVFGSHPSPFRLWMIIQILYNPLMAKNKPPDEILVAKYIIIYKFLLGLIETLLGFGMIVFGDQIYDLYINFRNGDFFEDPHDFLAIWAEKIIPYLFIHKGYVVLILLLLGITKMVGTAGLWYRKHWGLDILIIVTIGLLPFETYALVASPSFSKTAFFIINLFIALYLVNFKPHHYFINFKNRVTSK